MELSETFWVGFYTAVMACFLGMANVLYKSKCKKVKCAYPSLRLGTKPPNNENQKRLQSKNLSQWRVQ